MAIIINLKQMLRKILRDPLIRRSQLIGLQRFHFASGLDTTTDEEHTDGEAEEGTVAELTDIEKANLLEKGDIVGAEFLKMLKATPLPKSSHKVSKEGEGSEDDNEPATDLFVKMNADAGEPGRDAEKYWVNPEGEDTSDEKESRYLWAETEDQARRMVLHELIKQKVNKTDQEWAMVETFDKLNIYKDSQKLTHMLKESLDSSQMDYVEKKLASSKSHAARHVAKQMAGGEDSHMIRQRYTEGILAQKAPKQQLMDSIAMEGEKMHQLQNFPANKADWQPRHMERTRLTNKEYRNMIDTQVEETQLEKFAFNHEWRDKGDEDIPEVFKKDIYALFQEGKDDRDNKPGDFLDNKLDEELSDMEENSDLDEIEDATPMFEDTIWHKAGKRDGYEFDRPSDDMPGGPSINEDALYVQWKKRRDGRLVDETKGLQIDNILEKDEEQQNRIIDMGPDDLYFRALVVKYGQGVSEGFQPDFHPDEIKHLAPNLDRIVAQNMSDDNPKVEVEQEDYLQVMMSRPTVFDLEEEEEDRRDELSEAEDDKDVDNEIKESITSQYTAAEHIIHGNYRQRRRLAKYMLHLREEFDKLKQARYHAQDHIVSTHQKTMGMQADRSAMSFSAKERALQREEKDALLSRQVEVLASLRKQFDPKSKDPAHYENELKLVSKLGLLTNKPQQTLDEFDYVLDHMQKNKIRLTPAIHARLFEYATLNGSFELANSTLKKLRTSNSHIDAGYLEKYFEACVRKDALQGVAFLMNYCEQNAVDISMWDLSVFRSAIDYYLNDNFNLNKIMVFVKAYTHFYNSRAANYKGPNMMEDHADLVDMKSLFSFLVNKVGDHRVVDPVTKSDTLWELIELASKPQFAGLLDTADIANYLNNHIGSGATLEKTFSLIDKFQSPELARQMLGHLQKSDLPRSFDKTAVKQFYLKAKAAGQLEKLSSSKELMYYLLKENGLLGEVLDFSEATGKSEISNYYVSETILQTKLHWGQTYSKAIEDIDCEVTQKVKAMFLDNGVKEAIAYLNEKVAEKRVVQKARQDFLVGLYDSMFPEGSGTVFFEEFKTSYLKGTALANQIAQESLIAGKLESIVANKQYHNIELMFNLYTVMKEEQAMTGDTNFESLADKPEFLKGRVTGLTRTQKEALVPVLKRRKQLEKALSVEEMEEMRVLSSMLEDASPEVLVTKAPILKHMKKIFKGYNLTSCQQIRKQLMVLKEKEEMEEEDPNKSVFKTYEADAAELFEQLFIYPDEEPDVTETQPTHMDDAWARGKLENEGIMSVKDAVAHRIRRIRDQTDYGDEDERAERHDNDEVDKVIENYADTYYNTHEEMPGEWNPDPEAVRHDAKDVTLLSLKEKLIEAMASRRQEVLPLALQCFAKIQQKQVSTTKFEEFAEDDADELIAKLELLLNNSASPVVSTIRQTAKYSNEFMQNQAEMIAKNQNLNEALDMSLPEIHRDSERLQLLEQELNEIDETMHTMTEDLMEVAQEAKKIPIVKQHGEWMNSSEAQFNSTFKASISALYADFQEARKDGHVLTREQKLSLMKNALAVDGDDEFGSSGPLSTFYAQDLIRFGIRHNFPDAVRAGEKLMLETGEKLPREVAMSVKNYMLKHSDAYYSREAMERSGPLDSAALYRSTRKTGVQPLFCLDDPYWNNMLKKNYKREDQYKTPQIWSWEHKPDGLMGEVYDMDAVREKQQRFAHLTL